MAQRDYSKEGLNTEEDRFDFTNELAEKIYGAVNSMMDNPNEIEADTEEEYIEKLYERTIDFIRRKTAKAWGDRDAAWLKDASAAINFIVPQYTSLYPDQLKKRLLAVLQETWNNLGGVGK